MNETLLENFIFDSVSSMTGKQKREVMEMMSEEKVNVSNDIINKLYMTALNKSKMIDYGDIPKTKGDITKYKHYQVLVDTCNFLDTVNAGTSAELTTGVGTIRTTMGYLEHYRSNFMNAFTNRNELLEFIYNNMVLSIINSLDLLLVNTVDYVRTPDATYTAVLDTSGRRNSVDMTVLLNMEKFNSSVSKGELLKIFNMYKNKGNLAGESSVVKEVADTPEDVSLEPDGSTPPPAELASEIAFSIPVIVGIGIVSIGVFISLIREIVYQFFSLRTKLSDRINALIVNLEMHKTTVQSNNTLGVDKRNQILKKQEKIINTLDKLFNLVSIDLKVSAKKGMVNVQSELPSIADDIMIV